MLLDMNLNNKIYALRKKSVKTVFLMLLVSSRQSFMLKDPSSASILRAMELFKSSTNLWMVYGCWSCLEDITVPVHWMGSKGISSLMSSQRWSQCFFAILVFFFVIWIQTFLKNVERFWSQGRAFFHYKFVELFIFGLLSGTSLWCTTNW